MRRGRVLVECCVALVLLSAGSALVLLVTANTAHLVDDSRQRDLLQRETANRVASVSAAPCHGTASASPRTVTPRMILDVVTSVNGPVRSVVVDGYWQSSAAAGGAWRHHATAISGWCE